MSDNRFTESANEIPVCPYISLKRLLSLCTLLSLILLLAPGSIQARNRQVINQDLFSVTFPTEQKGWACGRWGMVLHTEDGGENWVRQPSGTDYVLTSICFSDPQNGWAVGEEGVIIHTKDGGRSWVKQNCPKGYFLEGVCFATDQKGWAVTEWTTILYTEDEGDNWEVQFKGEDYILKAVSFCDELNGWAAGEYGFIYHTSDGGRNWEHQAGFFEFADDAFELRGGNTLFDVYAVDPTSAWVVGIDGYIGRTLDGGKTWERVKCDFEMTQLFGVCSDAEGSTVLIGGKGWLIASADRGKHFMIPEIDPPIIYGWLYGIARRGARGFVAVGKEGWIYLSDDRAMSWKRAMDAKGTE